MSDKNYSYAPYNFVSFPKSAVFPYKSIDELPGHDFFSDRDGRELLRGTIEYTIESKTPIMIGCKKEDSGEVDFFRNEDGKYAIPGNSIRGLIRTNAQILSSSPVVSGDYTEIEDSQFLYRDMASNTSLSKKYNSILGPNTRGIHLNLSAGYIYNDNGNYYIKESERIDDYPYLDIKEPELMKLNPSVIKDENLMYTRALLRDKNLDKLKDRGKRNGVLKKYINRRYEPYFKEISYEYDANKKIRKIDNKDKLKNKGYILSSGFILGKIRHLIIPEPGEKRIDIDKKIIDAYLDDMAATQKIEKTANGIKIKKGKEFYDLPKNGDKKPIFFIKQGDRLHIGFTPSLRLIYGGSVLDGLSPNYKGSSSIGYVDSMFGFSREEASYKTRIGFSDATVVGDKPRELSAIEMQLVEPKAASVNLYLKQDEEKSLVIYEDEFELRGFKKYWLKEKEEIPNSDGFNKEISFKMKPLDRGTEFKGRIYFENLKKDELGLLLLALRLEEGSNQNIGLAKPYGYGRIELGEVSLKLQKLEDKYGGFSFDYEEERDIGSYIDYFKENFEEKYIATSFDSQRHIEELYKMTNTIVKTKDIDDYKYMELGKNNKNNYLPEALSYEDKIKELKNKELRGGKRQKNKNKYNKKKSPKAKNIDPIWAVLNDFKKE